MSKYQVAIIGTNIGAKHYEDFQKVSDKFNVHTICGLTKESIDNIIPSNSNIKISPNFKDALKIIHHIILSYLIKQSMEF